MKTINLILTIIISCTWLNTIRAAGYSNADQTVTFVVTIDTAIKHKPYLLVYPNMFYADDSRSANPVQIDPVVIKGNVYLFKLPAQTKPRYFSLAYDNGNWDVFLLSNYFFEPGDQISVSLKKSVFPDEFDADFSGKNAAKYNCQEEFIAAERMELDKMTAENMAQNGLPYALRLINARQSLIEKYRTGMSDYAYFLLKTDMICKQLTVFEHHKKVSIEAKAWLPEALSGVPDSIFMDSKEYLSLKLKNMRIDFVDTSGHVNFTEFFKGIKSIKDPLLRDRMMVVFFINYWVRIATGFDELIDDAANTAVDQQSLQILLMFQNNVIGRKAFNFSLTDVHGKNVTFDSFKGKIVFIDFWFTGCVHCEFYYQGVLKDVEEKYSDNENIVFVTVCIDKDKDSWLKSVKSGLYTSNKAVNLYTNGEGVSNDLIRYYNIKSYPRPMLIGADGNILVFAGGALRKKENLVAALDKSLGALK